MLKTDEEVQEAVQEQEIISVILQPFNGWSGDTVFNWKTGRSGSSAVAATTPIWAVSPEVKINQNFMGFFRMELVENGKAVLVKAP